MCGLLRANAQERVITGRVTTADGEPISSITVTSKNSKFSTVTDTKGNFKAKLNRSADILVFSSVGYASKEMIVDEKSTALSVQLSETSSELAQVVISALGFKENADKLGSTTSKITPADITRSGETGVINGLSGKASGLQITKSAGDPGAGSYIQIRGQNTITGSNQPLIIVDGVPVSNSTIGTDAAGVTQESRLNDINANDIASVQVLKGASAAALWGSRAANGVIVITTKRGPKTTK